MANLIDWLVYLRAPEIFAWGEGTLACGELFRRASVDCHVRAS